MPPPLERRRLLKAAAGLAMSAPATARAERRRQAAERFDLNLVEISVPGLNPAHDGLTLAQLSDVHVGRHTPDGRVRRAVEAVNAAEPDLVMLTGDYVTTHKDPLDRVAELLDGLAAPTFAVLGNHDHWSGPRRIRRGLERVGYTVLQNGHTQLSVRGEPVTVLGVDDGHTGRDDVAATFRGAPVAGSRIVLAHTPPTAAKLPPAQGLVCFSGHTHGGHFVIPGLTRRMFERAGQPYIRGLYAVEGNFLYVNRGLGFGRGGSMVRLGSEPEVALITLRCGPSRDVARPSEG